MNSQFSIGFVIALVIGLASVPFGPNTVACPVNRHTDVGKTFEKSAWRRQTAKWTLCVAAATATSHAVVLVLSALHKRIRDAGRAKVVAAAAINLSLLFQLDVPATSCRDRGRVGEAERHAALETVTVDADNRRSTRRLTRPAAVRMRAAEARPWAGARVPMRVPSARMHVRQVAAPATSQAKHRPSPDRPRRLRIPRTDKAAATANHSPHNTVVWALV